MPRSKYEEIYKKIRDDIILGKYTNGDYLPSENEYVNHFGCTRNTIRRALYMLEQEGFVLPQHGKGVQVIYKDEEGKSADNHGYEENGSLFFPAIYSDDKGYTSPIRPRDERNY